MAQRGLIDPEKEDPFSLFVASTQIRYCYYNETHTILGNTFGMCVLQDFEALTPNLLARTIETVEGGGVIVMLVSNLKSLSQLYQLTMDVHTRYRTDAHQKVTARFNERMVLSLAQNQNCVLMDDELNILPTSSKVKNIVPQKLNEEGGLLEDPNRELNKELQLIQTQLQDTQPIGNLVECTVTLDQAKSLMTLMDALSEKSMNNTVAMTATRGRGKSACLGLTIAGALALGYSNVFVTSPSPENLKTLFQFVFKGLDALGFKEHLHYDIQESTNPKFAKAVIRVNVYKHHRQTVQYILPEQHNKLSQAELVVIDEAASIPLTVVRNLLGPYLVFMCSTINGYEGTGRSLSLKLISQLRQSTVAQSLGKKQDSKLVGRTLRETELNQPIRYATNDPIESWLNEVLCLDAASHIPTLPSKLPHPEECDLYYVERDTLFSYHQASEIFLQRMMSLYVASHYKNQPNDLMLMGDAPAHQIYVLLAPVDETRNALPEILCMLQVALEGAISQHIAMQAVASGQLPQGDLIPWTIGQQYQDPNFPKLSGCRVVRIATHPDLVRGGYGSRAIDQLKSYFQGDIVGLESMQTDPISSKNQLNNISNNNGSLLDQKDQSNQINNGYDNDYDNLQNEELKPRQGLPPLLQNLEERPAERLQYVGVSFGITQSLYNFWSKSQFHPLYLRQTPNDTTGEHTMIMVCPLKSSDIEGGIGWLDQLVGDFKGRFRVMLGSSFKQMDSTLALQILNPKLEFNDDNTRENLLQRDQISKFDGSKVNAHDIKRLQAYSNNTVDHHLIMDLVPILAHNYLVGNLPCSFSYTQCAILLNFGCQLKSLDEICEYLDLPANQILALFNKTIKRLTQVLKKYQEDTISKASQLNNPIKEKESAQQEANIVRKIPNLIPEDDADVDKEAIAPSTILYHDQTKNQEKQLEGMNKQPNGSQATIDVIAKETMNDLQDRQNKKLNKTHRKAVEDIRRQEEKIQENLDIGDLQDYTITANEQDFKMVTQDLDLKDLQNIQVPSIKKSEKDKEREQEEKGGTGNPGQKQGGKKIKWGQKNKASFSQNSNQKKKFKKSK